MYLQSAVKSSPHLPAMSNAGWANNYLTIFLFEKIWNIEERRLPDVKLSIYDNVQLIMYSRISAQKKHNF
jgi:hypothetical protein